MTTPPPLVTLVGAGALGSHLLYAARNLPVRWRVVDDDRVTAANTLSQLHPRTVTGQNKASAITVVMRNLFGLMVESRPFRIGEYNADAMLGGSSLVVDAVDNAPTRRLLAAWAVEHGVPCMHLAIAAEGAFGRVAWTAPGGPRFEPDEAPVGAATCANGLMLPRLLLVASAGAEALGAWLQAGERQAWSAGPRWAKVES
jgi:molybdopterin/thiamine biosynthesis adenylyltransferase